MIATNHGMHGMKRGEIQELLQIFLTFSPKSIRKFISNSIRVGIKQCKMEDKY